MSDTDAIALRRATAKEVLIDVNGARLTNELIAIAKLQVLAVDPDAWFKGALGIAPPSPLREIEPATVAIAWLAPGEWLVTGPETDVERVRARCAEAAGAAGLMVDLTHARTAFELSGCNARAVLSAHCPLDFSESAMPVGATRRSTFSDTGFFISRRADREGLPRFRLIFDQTMAAYAERMLDATISGVAS